LKTLVLGIVLIGLSPCATGQLVYTNNSETISLDHPTVLQYIKGSHIKTSERHTYSIVNDTLTITTPLLPIATDRSKFSNSITGQQFLFSKDSLVNTTTGATYYSPNVQKARNRKAGKGLYVVIDGVKHKIRKNSDRNILTTINMSDYNVTSPDNETAYRLYNINKKYTTLVLTKK